MPVEPRSARSSEKTPRACSSKIRQYARPGVQVVVSRTADAPVPALRRADSRSSARAADFRGTIRRPPNVPVRSPDVESGPCYSDSRSLYRGIGPEKMSQAPTPGETEDQEVRERRRFYDREDAVVLERKTALPSLRRRVTGVRMKGKQSNLNDARGAAVDSATQDSGEIDAGGEGAAGAQIA